MQHFLFWQSKKYCRNGTQGGTQDGTQDKLQKQIFEMIEGYPDEIEAIIGLDMTVP